MAGEPTGSGILDPTALSFAFGAGTGTPSYQELARRRAIAQAIASQRRPFPKNLGEGIASLGEAVGDRMADARLSGQERAFDTAETSRMAAGNALAPPTAGRPLAAPAVPVTPAVPPVPGVKPSADAIPALGRDSIVAAMNPPPTPAVPGVPPANPTLAEGSPPPQTTASLAQPTGDGSSADDGMWGARMGAIGGIETGGTKNPYGTVGKAQTKYGNALGKYGVMTANVPKWTQEALGQALTPEEFLANPQAQDAVFKHRFGSYVARFGEEGAARAWFGGPGNINKPNITDAYERLSIGDYGKDYLKRLQGAAPTSGASDAEAGDPGATSTIDTATGVEENPPTPTSIRPMASDVRRLATPAPTEQAMADPGAEPTPPERVEYGPRQLKMLEIMQHRGTSPEMKAAAERQFNMDEKIRTELMARREADYINKRERWEKKTDEKAKFDREAPVRRIDELIKLGQFDKAKGELEKMEFERGETRELGLAKARLEVAQAARTLAKPDTAALKGTQYERPYDPGKPPDQQAGAYAVPSGLPAPELNKLTETQAKTVKFMQRAVVASSQLGDAGILAGLVDTAKGKLPIGGNYWVSPEYQKAQNAAFTWAQAVLRDESGAVLGAGEIANKMKAYFPQPGDNEQTIRDKAFRRKTEEESFYHGLGDAKGAIDTWREERKTRRVPTDESGKPKLAEGTLRINNRTGLRQRVMGGHWENEEDLH